MLPIGLSIFYSLNLFVAICYREPTYIFGQIYLNNTVNSDQTALEFVLFAVYQDFPDFFKVKC